MLHNNDDAAVGIRRARPEFDTRASGGCGAIHVEAITDIGALTGQQEGFLDRVADMDPEDLEDLLSRIGEVVRLGIDILGRPSRGPGGAPAFETGTMKNHETMMHHALTVTVAWMRDDEQGLFALVDGNIPMTIASLCYAVSQFVARTSGEELSKEAVANVIEEIVRSVLGEESRK